MVTIVDIINLSRYNSVKECYMKVATVREFRDKATRYFKEEEPVLVTRHGKVTGLYLPIDHPESFPIELRKDLLVRIGDSISRSLAKKGISEEKLLADFKTFKQTRRRR
jgi:PHD/YefM family antitoxin component YafN of YafNO toxin-antitoxin module